MELLRSNLSRVRIPDLTTRIFNQECCISFNTPKSDGGLYIDMNSFLAFGKDFVDWNYEKSGNPVYLHIKQTRKAVAEDSPSKKPTLLAIVVGGGFNNSEPEYDESYEIVILPDYITLPFPSMELPEKVRLAVDAILLADAAERKKQLAPCRANKKEVSKHSMRLHQIHNGVTVPPSGWKCAKCDKTDNLWLNLTDGSILCGQRQWDGTGGNNHSINHYKQTGYPLAVKLGTITADLEAADVYSYDEYESVVDPLLGQHLAFFGIDFSSLHKTEMTTAERELDQFLNFDWSRIRQTGQELEPLFGPGYTGLINLGNSCYLAATMQILFSTHSFSSRYYKNQTLKMAFDKAPADPTVDLNMQLTKLAHGLLSGKYSISVKKNEDSSYAADSILTAKREGIRPRMFKSVIAASHPEFSNMKQQDALEFFLHFIDQVEQINVTHPRSDPSRSFKFGIEERLQCPSGKVAYNRRNNYVLSLNIPLYKATNKNELEAFQKLKAEKPAEVKKLRVQRVPLKDCLDCFSAPEEVRDFYSTSLKGKTTAIKTAGLTSFPDFLVLHMRKFVMEEGLVPKKLDVSIDVPEIIDISDMRSKGFQPGEELLLEDIDVPISQEAQNADVRTSSVDQSLVDTLLSFGFDEQLARKALKAAGGDVEKATDLIFNNAVPMGTSEAPMIDAELPDRGGRYRLFGMVTNFGASPHVGHYVAHIYKEGRWVVFNDDKVGVSKNPPINMGYLYFFGRLDS